MNQQTPSPCPLVLVIDHEPALRDLYRALFEGEGWIVVTMPSPKQCMDRILVDKPAAVVMDLLYGQDATSGIDLLRRVRKERAPSDLPIVVCSAAQRLAGQHAPEIEELGASLLHKPFNVDELLWAVQPAVSPSAFSIFTSDAVVPAPPGTSWGRVLPLRRVKATPPMLTPWFVERAIDR